MFEIGKKSIALLIVFLLLSQASAGYVKRCREVCDVGGEYAGAVLDFCNTKFLYLCQFFCTPANHQQYIHPDKYIQLISLFFY